MKIVGCAKYGYIPFGTATGAWNGGIMTPLGGWAGADEWPPTGGACMVVLEAEGSTTEEQQLLLAVSFS